MVLKKFKNQSSLIRLILSLVYYFIFLLIIIFTLYIIKTNEKINQIKIMKY